MPRAGGKHVQRNVPWAGAGCRKALSKGGASGKGYLDKMFDVKMEGVCTRVWLFDHLFKNRSP